MPYREDIDCNNIGLNKSSVVAKVLMGPFYPYLKIAFELVLPNKACKDLGGNEIESVKDQPKSILILQIYEKLNGICNIWSKTVKLRQQI